MYRIHHDRASNKSCDLLSEGRELSHKETEEGQDLKKTLETTPTGWGETETTQAAWKRFRTDSPVNDTSNLLIILQYGQCV